MQIYFPFFRTYLEEVFEGEPQLHWTTEFDPSKALRFAVYRLGVLLVAC